MSTQPGRGGILNAGGRAYEWVRKALGFYGTAVTLAQLIPALVALLAVTLSPTAWLSLTLRRWVLAGVIVGSVVGAAVFALTMRRLLRVDRTAEARTAEWRHAAGQGAEGRDREEPTAIERAAKERDGKGSAGTTAPPTRLRALAFWGLGTAVLALGLLRLHFAVVDVGVIERWPVLTPVFDFYLGGAPWQATSYNVVAALFSATALVGIVLGAPAAAMLRRDRRRARAKLAGEGGPLHAIAAAEKALTSAKSALSVARSTITSLTDERDSLRAEVALLRGDEAARTEAARTEERRTETARTEETHTEVERTDGVPARTSRGAGDHS
ncbi:MAG: hypothetical protein R6W77_00110 [Trueperaceae bacterium]